MAQMRIILNTTDGNNVSVDVRPDETYRMLKERLQVESGIELEVSQIFFDGKQVTEDQNVYDSFLSVNQNTVSNLHDKGDRVCIVEGCPTTKFSNPKKEIFKFPLETDRYSNWLLACNRHDLLGRIPVSLNLECGVCSDHFPVSSFVNGSMKKRLRKNATPVLEEQQSSFSILAQDILKAEVQLDNETCRTQNGSATYEVENMEDTLPLLPTAAVQEDDSVLIKDGSASENASNQDEVDEEDLQDDELEELEEDEEEEEIEEEEEDLLGQNSFPDHPGLVCRLCAKAVDDAYFIFSDEGKAEKLLDKISTSLPIAVHCDDLLPKQICSQCHSSLNVCYDFAMACVKAEKALQKMIPRFLCKKDPKVSEEGTVDLSEGNEKIIDQKCEEDESQCFNCPLCCKGHMKTEDNVNIEELEGKKLQDDPDVIQDFLVDSVMWEEGDGFLEPDQNYSEVEDELDDSSDNYIPCMVCAANFIALSHLFQHAETHHGEEYFPCGRCGLVFTSKDTLSIHLDLHMNSVSEERYKCGDCGKLFLSEARAEFHHEVTHGGSGSVSLACSECGQVFKHERNLWDHVQIVHKGQKPLSCPICGKTYQIRAQLKNHIHSHSVSGPFECEVCFKTFPDRSSLKSHEATHSNLKSFQCDQCGRCFSRKYLFTAHVRSHVAKKPRVYTCRVCGEDGFESLPKLLVHRRSVHQDVMLPLGSKKDKIHKCGLCNKAFTGRVALKHHAMSHAGDLPHVCEFCNKGFTQKRSLLLHRRIHTGEKPYECGDCGKRFVQSAHLYSHLRLHTGEKPYLCSECGASFRLKDVRDSHQRKHTGERPFKCKVCEKSFRTSHSYYQHTWIHTGRKPYPCTYCGKAFRRSNGLKVHIRIHTGEKPHECDVCGRGFAQKQDMKKHRNLHTMGRL